MKYNWQQQNWPEFRYNLDGLQDVLLDFSEKTGRVDGILSALPHDMQQERIIELMVCEALKSSQIEGEVLSRPDVMSSIKKNLGLVSKTKHVGDLRAKGIADLMFTVRNNYRLPVSADMLFDWHNMLLVGAMRIKTGQWRTHEDPMLIVSGVMGRETIHFEAPPSTAVVGEMKRFVQWFNESEPSGSAAIRPAPVRAAVSHIYFESIHPFEDGNGRIGRALAEKALSQGLGRPVLLSLSRAIEADRADYYAALKEAQRSLDITGWVRWFCQTLLKAQEMAETDIEFTMRKVHLFDRIGSQLNERQLKMVKRMLDAGPDGFQGGMSAKKYMSMTKASKATATRDLQELVAMNVLAPCGAGRSTHYDLVTVHGHVYSNLDGGD